MATHYQINHSEVPIRLFKSDFLEFFTHISPVAVVVIWLPVAVYFMMLAAQTSIGSGGYIPIAFLLGIFMWTFTEYTMHRFVFHFKPRTPAQERIIFLFHGVHHAQPQLKTRLVMPPVVSVPLAFVMYGLLSLILGLFGAPHWIAAAFSGTIIGYLVYDLTHYATHHLPMRWGYLKYLKQYHMKHHYKTEDKRFGVSSPLWDYVFGTIPTE
jgi:sterol desaturase/sphingolipid hydroxylase (fatty acid hydroxylase superfamily)